MKHLKEIKNEIPSSSMADIAFLLLIFFMLTTTFRNEKSIIQKLPEENSSTKTVLKVVSIYINESNEILFNDKKIIDKKELHLEIRKELSKYRDCSFLIRTNLKTNYSDFISILDCLKSAGARNIYQEI